MIRPGRSFTWRWSLAGHEVGSVVAYVGLDGLELRYRVTEAGGDPQSVRCRVAFTETPCPFGGTRTWFACPRCSRRCAVVYSGGSAFACRLCLRLGYLSESMSPLDRAWHRLRKLEGRLAEDWEKPKRMRWTTYERICARLDALEALGQGLMWPATERLLERLAMADG